MKPALKSSNRRSSSCNISMTETTARHETLIQWIGTIQDAGAGDSLFEMEMWLQAIRSFFAPEHLSLGESERSGIVNRSFVSEFEIVRQAVSVVEDSVQNLIALEHKDSIGVDAFMKAQWSRERAAISDVSHTAEQLTPNDSVVQLQESLNGFRIVLDAVSNQSAKSYQLFLILGRYFNHELRYCLYIDMLTSRAFRLRNDRIENKSIDKLLGNIGDKRLRRNTSLAFLALFRFLKYLKPISNDLKRDRPLKLNLAIFSLLHQEMGQLVEWLRRSIPKPVKGDPSLYRAAGMLSLSLKTESQRVMNKELVGVSQESEPAKVYEKIENAHGLIRNCCQSGILSLIQAMDEDFDAGDLFPARKERMITGEKMRTELYSLRQWLIEVLENRQAPDAGQIIVRLNEFKESSMHSLMYRDWAEFDALLDALSIDSSFIEIRTHIRKFINFLDTLMKQLAQRRLSQKKQVNS
jgi:hypothetical protein